MREPKSLSKPGFGKRGQVSMPGAPRPNDPRHNVPEPTPAASTGGFSLPKWLIGGCAALLLMGLVSGGTGGGFLGGLLGGLLANKLINSNKPAAGDPRPTKNAMPGSDQADRSASGTRSPSATSPGATSSPSQTSINRGGLGTTTSSGGSSGGSSFFGG